MADAELPEAIVLAPGDSRVVELPGHGSGGYMWSAEVTDGDLAIAEVPAERDDGSALGGSAPARFRLSARGAGEARVRFSLSRPWEKAAPAETRELRVTVGPQPARPTASSR